MAKGRAVPHCFPPSSPDPSRKPPPSRPRPGAPPALSHKKFPFLRGSAAKTFPVAPACLRATEKGSFACSLPSSLIGAGFVPARKKRGLHNAPCNPFSAPVPLCRCGELSRQPKAGRINAGKGGAPGWKNCKSESACHSACGFWAQYHPVSEQLVPVFHGPGCSGAGSCQALD